MSDRYPRLPCPQERQAPSSAQEERSMKKNDTATPIPANVTAVMTVFAEQLEKVAFPDVSSATLKELADKVHAKVEQVQKAESALESAQDKLAASQQELTALAARALAYAKIYAEDKPALAKQLSEINLRAPKAAKKTRSKSSGPKAAKPAKDKGGKSDKTEMPEKAEKPEKPEKPAEAAAKTATKTAAN